MHRNPDDSHSEAKPEETATQPLDDRHRTELRASGIRDEIIAACRIYSGGSAELTRVLGWSAKHRDWGRGMIFPFLRPGEADPTYCRVKPDFPRLGKDGDPVKYEAPRGKPLRAYFPPNFAELSADVTQRIVLTEGEKKALAAASYGYACIGLTGVWSWQQARPRTQSGKAYGERELIPDLLAIAWKDRDVVIAFDSDMADKPIVKLAAIRLSEALTELGAEVSVATLAPGPQGEKTGLDDFIVREGADALASLAALIDSAKPAGEPPTLEPMDWAHMWLDGCWRTAEGYTIRWYRDEWFAYMDGCYLKSPESDLEAVLTLWLNAQRADCKKRNTAEVLRAASTLCRVPFDMKVPCWLNRSVNRDQ